jgi:hypothetical protein
MAITFDEVDVLDLDSTATNAVGMYAVFKDIDRSGNRSWSDCTGVGCDFRFTDWKSAEFVEVNVYHHIDAVQRHIQTLGFTLAKRCIEVDSDANVGSLYAKYENSPLGSGSLSFGNGPNRYLAGADGEIVVHEYAHALQMSEVLSLDSTAEAQGIAEGFADFMALSWFAEWKKARQPAACLECVAPFMNGGSCLRNIGTAGMYDPSETSRVVFGKVWAKALWVTLQAIEAIPNMTPQDARDIVYRGLLLGHRRYGTTLAPPSLPAAAHATLAAVKDDTGKTDAYFDQFCNGFTNRGILSDADCTAIKNLPVVIPLSYLP